jgi:hypothetical protein
MGIKLIDTAHWAAVVRTSTLEGMCWLPCLGAYLCVYCPFDAYDWCCFGLLAESLIRADKRAPESLP